MMKELLNMSMQKGLALAMIISLSGCMAYTYGGKRYSSQEAALAAEKTHLEEAVAKIPIAAKHVGGSLRVCLPDSNTIYEKATVGGNIGRQFVGTALETDFLTVVSALSHRGAFDKVETVRTSGERCEARPGDRGVVYMYMPKLNVAGWYFTSKSIEKESLHFDKGEEDLAARYTSFAITVETLARASE